MATTTLKLYVSIDAEMDDDSANVLGVTLCQHTMEYLQGQQVPCSIVTSFAEHQ